MSTLRSEDNKGKFVWAKYEQILKDLITKIGNFNLKEGDCAELAKDMRETYKVENVTAEIVRSKTRTPKFKKWLKKEEKGGSKGDSNKKKRKREISSSSSSSDSSYSSSESGNSDSEDIESSLNSNYGSRGFAAQPVFWSISDSDRWWYFMVRKWKIEASHRAGKQFLEIQYKIDPPTVFDVEKLIKRSKQPTLKLLDINNPNIQNQIKDWKPITWKVALPTPIPLIPSLYQAAKDEEYSWITVPRNNPKRSTAFGDDDVDVDYVIKDGAT
jgi:hypothetical protein